MVGTEIPSTWEFIWNAPCLTQTQHMMCVFPGLSCYWPHSLKCTKCSDYYGVLWTPSTLDVSSVRIYLWDMGLYLEIPSAIGGELVPWTTAILMKVLQQSVGQEFQGHDLVTRQDSVQLGETCRHQLLLIIFLANVPGLAFGIDKVYTCSAFIAPWRGLWLGCRGGAIQVGCLVLCGTEFSWVGTALIRASGQYSIICFAMSSGWWTILIILEGELFIAGYPGSDLLVRPVLMWLVQLNFWAVVTHRLLMVAVLMMVMSFNIKDKWLD